MLTTVFTGGQTGVDQAARIRAWLDGQAVNVLNVAGPSEGTAPGIGARVEALLRAVFGSLYS